MFAVFGRQFTAENDLNIWVQRYPDANARGDDPTTLDSMANFTIEEALSLVVGPHFKLAGVDPDSTPGFPGDRDDWEEEFHQHDDELDELQERLFANSRKGIEDTGGILLVLQGMDTSGKGGVIRNVMRVFDPQGIDTKSFGRPTDEEASHDFLWRIRPHAPKSGEIVVFDRSHYEDVLVQRVHEMAPDEEIERRYGAIIEFEREMADRGIRIIKVMLHISKDFQKENLIERLERPEKYWKYNPNDRFEREHWDDYQEAFEIALKRTSTHFAPWYCVPSDNKRYARMVVKHLLLHALRGMELEWPEADFDVEAELKKMKKA